MKFSDFFSTGVSDVVTSVGNVIDETFTSDEERLLAKAKLETIFSNFKIKMGEVEVALQAEITKRWQSDNQGSWLPRNVRPLSLVYLTFVITVLALSDGNITKETVDGTRVAIFNIKPGYIDLFGNLTLLAYGAYFSWRGYEKVKGVVK